MPRVSASGRGTWPGRAHVLGRRGRHRCERGRQRGRRRGRFGKGGPGRVKQAQHDATQVDAVPRRFPGDRPGSRPGGRPPLGRSGVFGSHGRTPAIARRATRLLENGRTLGRAQRRPPPTYRCSRTERLWALRRPACRGRFDLSGPARVFDDRAHPIASASRFATPPTAAPASNSLTTTALGAPAAAAGAASCDLPRSTPALPPTTGWSSQANPTVASAAAPRPPSTHRRPDFRCPAGATVAYSATPMFFSSPCVSFAFGSMVAPDSPATKRLTVCRWLSGTRTTEGWAPSALSAYR